jgi:hypothetical protein
VEGILVSVNQQTQGLCEELNAKIEERHLILQTSLNMQTMKLLRGGHKDLCEEIADIKKNRHAELDIMIHGAQVEIEIMRILVEII